MGCSSSKVAEPSVVKTSLPILEAIRSSIVDVSDLVKPEDVQNKLLRLIDSKLQSAFLDKAISQCVSVTKNGIVSESQVPMELRDLLDDNLKHLCYRTDALVDCYLMLVNVTKSTKFVSFSHDDIEFRFIAHQFTEEKDYDAFLYDISSKVVSKNNYCEYSENFEFEGASYKVSPVEKTILTGLSHIMDVNQHDGEWNSFYNRIQNSLKEREGMVVSPVSEKHEEEEKPIEEEMKPVKEEMKPEEKPIEKEVKPVEEEKPIEEEVKSEERNQLKRRTH